MAEENTRELLIRVSATTELLRSQLTAAERELDGFEKKAQAANDNVDRAMKKGAVSAGQMRFAMRDLAAQAGDVATQFALGARPMQIFASQGSQVAGAIGLMAGEATALGRFLSGPWFQALNIAAIVLGPMVAKLFEGEGAMKAVSAASSGLSDAQSVLAGIFDMTTGKIKSQNEMLLLNARIQAINLRADAAAKGASAKSILGSASDGRASLLDQIVSTVTFRPMSQDINTSQRAKALAETVRRLRAGTVRPSTVAKWAENFSFTGLRVSREDFIQAIADEATAQGKRQTADLIDQSLGSGTLATGLRTDAKVKKPKKARQPAPGFLDTFKGIDNLATDNNRDLWKDAEDRMKRLNQANEDQWKEQRKAIQQNADFEFEERQRVEERLRSIREAQLGLLSNLYEDLFRGGTRAIWQDFAQIGQRVIAQVLAKFTLAQIKGGGFDFGSAVSTSLQAVLGFADGGRPPVGRVSVVGERGPELFVPDAAGTVIPNHALGGGQQIVINMPNANQDTIAMVRREIINAAPAIAAAASGQTARMLNRRTL